MSENKKIPYPFIPLPRFFVENEHMQDAHFLKFICFAFGRTYVEPTFVVFYKKPIFLEAFEFIFGRARWSELLLQEEHVVRKYISRLLSQHLVRKIASKSTSKYTVFAWERERFDLFSSQQNDRKLASKLTVISPQTKNKNIEKETTTGTCVQKGNSNVTSSDVVAVFSEVGNLNLEVQKMMLQLSSEEQQKVLQLFKSSAKKQTIKNPSGWVRRCVEKGWHHEQQPLVVETLIPSSIEENKKLATLIAKKLSSTSTIQMVMRSDFIEVEGKQLFYYEESSFFRKYLVITMQKAGFDLHEIFPGENP